MIHYHGTPLGGTRARGEEFAAGRFLLVPWKRPEDLEMVASVSRGFILDNSAFSFWTSGEKPEWNGYLDWCRTVARNPRFNFALIPDVIDGTEKDNDDLLRIWDRGGHWPIRVEGCAVWHLHESFDRLKMLVQRFRWVAMGSSGEWSTPGTDDWRERMDEAFGVICDDDGFPRAKIHGLRMLRSDIVIRYPFASCDSTNAAQNGPREGVKLGTDSLWGSANIARKIEQVQSPSRWCRKKAMQGDLFEMVR